MHTNTHTDGPTGAAAHSKHILINHAGPVPKSCKYPVL